MVRRAIGLLACLWLNHAQAAGTGLLKIHAENCIECHGQEGVGISASAPKLAGQYADYIVKQLRDFQSGQRIHPVMNPMAEGLSEQDRQDIAAHYASFTVMRGEGSVHNELYQGGDAARGIPACKSCHGETGKGKNFPTESYPVIGGQHRIYLREQLLAWRNGMRTNSTVMNVIAKPLSDAEIEALADYISGL